MDTDKIQAFTQAILAVAVVIGGGALVFLHPDSGNAALMGVIGTVLGWYFRGATTAQITSQTIRALKAEAVNQSLTS